MRYHYATPATEGPPKTGKPEERLLYPIVGIKGKGVWVPASPKSPEQRQRLAAALRENLLRRKARARALAGHEAPQGSETGENPSCSLPKKAGKPD